MSITCRLFDVYISDDSSANTRSGNNSLGNQLFIIASTYGIAVKNNLSVKISDVKKFILIWGNKYIKNFFKNINTDEIIETTEFRETKLQRNKFNDIKCDDGCVLIGYFQSYKYFSDIQPIILNLFSIDDETKKIINEKYYDLFKNYDVISIHVRMGDFISTDRLIDNIYYEKSINHMKKKLKNCKFIIISDNVEWCKTHFIGDEYYFNEDTDDCVDLYTMTMCYHNITANSTFSWWGAYLNQNNNKIVTYPSDMKWFSKKNTKKIKKDYFPSDWIEI